MKIQRYNQYTKQWIDNAPVEDLLDYLFTDASPNRGAIEDMGAEIIALRKSLALVTKLLIESGHIDLNKITEALGSSYSGAFKVDGRLV